MNLEQVISRIQPVGTALAAACIARFDQVAKPLGSLGKLEELLARIAAVSGSVDINIARKAVVVFCADNGVVKQGVAAHNHQVTTAVAALLQSGRASVSLMAKTCGAEVFSVDIGMVDTVRGLHHNKLAPGTDDITQGRAMNRHTTEQAISVGIEIAAELKDKGYNLLAGGEVGIGNTTTSSALCSVLLNRSVSEVTGRGAGLDDAGLSRKISVIEQAIAINRPDTADPLDMLSKLGGLDIAALTGLFLGGALYKLPVVMDGFIAGVAALLAVRLCAAVRGYILPSHASGEPGARFVLAALGFSPVIEGDMRLGEGTGAVALFPLLDMALAVYREAATFADIKIDQ